MLSNRLTKTTDTNATNRIVTSTAGVTTRSLQLMKRIGVVVSIYFPVGYTSSGYAKAPDQNRQWNFWNAEQVINGAAIIGILAVLAKLINFFLRSGYVTKVTFGK